MALPALRDGSGIERFTILSPRAVERSPATRRRRIPDRWSWRDLGPIRIPAIRSRSSGTARSSAARRATSHRRALGVSRRPPRQSQQHIGREARAKIELGQDWLVTGPVRKYDSPAEAEWMAARGTTHPQGCFTEPVFL